MRAGLGIAIIAAAQSGGRGTMPVGDTSDISALLSDLETCRSKARAREPS